MFVSFELSMPGRNSWNGRWSGEERCYVRVVSVGGSKKAAEKYTRLVGAYRYNFGDGWVACVKVRIVDAATARKLRKVSAGFCGYDWMIASIRDHGDIYGPAHPLPTTVTSARAGHV